MTKQSVERFFCHSFVNIFMSKKLLIYGLAFGSAAAALSYIYMIKVAFRPDLWMHLTAIAGEFLIIPGLAIYLFLKALKNSKPEEFVMGRAIFLGFFLSIMISASVSLFYSYISQFRPDIILAFTELKIDQFKKSNFISKLNAKEIDENINAIRESYSVGGQFKYQLYLGAARGLFLSAIIAFILKAKTAKN